MLLATKWPYMKRRNLVCVGFIGICLLGVSLQSEELQPGCVKLGDCSPCEKHEMTKPYCEFTGYRQEILCQNPTKVASSQTKDRIPEYIKCSPLYSNTAEMMRFEMFMLIIGLISFWALRKQKAKHISSFDQRREQQQVQKGLMKNQK